MLVVREIIGRLCDAAFEGRRVERLAVRYADAAKARSRLRTDAGTDVALDLPRGTFLADGAVLHDDGVRVVAVERVLEDALVVHFDPTLAREDLVAGAVRLGHVFGNQHVPLEIHDGEVRLMITTSNELARATVDGLGLRGVTAAVERVALGRFAPLTGPAGHASGHTAHRHA